MNHYKLIIIIFLLIILGGTTFSDGFGLDYEGEIRNRFAYGNNYDLDYDRIDGKIAADVRARIDFTITTPLSFYMSYKLQLGNIALDEQLFNTDNFLENIRLETRNIYIGWENSIYDIKAGLITIKSPSEVVIDDENAGLKINADLDNFKIKSFYSMTNLVDGYFNLIDNDEGVNHLFFIGAETDQYLDTDFNLWLMYLNGNDDSDYSYDPVWAGIEIDNKNTYFDIESKFIYNSGVVNIGYIDFDVPISAFYMNTKISVEPLSDTALFTRFNLTGSLSSATATINQFQVINGEGSLDTGLGLLFGGSSYSSESYFSSESVSIIDDNLSSGDLVLDDPGLFIYELGFSQNFDFLPFSSELIIGGANTCGLFSDEGYFSSLLGLEADLHNKMKITDDLDFYLSMSILFAGNSFEEVFTINNTDTDIGSDTSFKMDCKIVYSF